MIWKYEHSVATPVLSEFSLHIGGLQDSPCNYSVFFLGGGEDMEGQLLYSIVLSFCYTMK